MSVLEYLIKNSKPEEYLENRKCKKSNNICLDENELSELFGPGYRHSLTEINEIELVCREGLRWILILNLNDFCYLIEYTKSGINIEVNWKRKNEKRLRFKKLHKETLIAQTQKLKTKIKLVRILSLLEKMKLKWNKENYDHQNQNSKAFATEFGKIIGLDFDSLLC